jgi:hypothetical protein
MSIVGFSCRPVIDSNKENVSDKLNTFWFAYHWKTLLGNNVSWFTHVKISQLVNKMGFSALLVPSY